MPQEETFPVPMKYIDVTRTTHTSLDEMLVKKIEVCWNVDGERKLSDAWTGFTRFFLPKERPPEGYTWSRRRLTRELKKLLVLMMCGQICGNLYPMQPRRNARQSRGIFFTEPNDEGFKLTVGAARTKLEVPMPAGMPCKIPIKSSGELHRNIWKRKTKYACIVGDDECTRPRPEGAGHKPHQDHITAEGVNSMTHESLVHKFIPMPQALKIPDARQQWRNNGKN